MSKITELASNQITATDQITIELVGTTAELATVRVTWPPHPTITTPAKYAEMAATAMRILANASTELARIKAGTR